MTEQKIKISNRAGIHARPAAILVSAAKNFSSSIYFEKNSTRINAKSILGIMSLGAAYGNELNVIADGDDEKEAMAALIRLFESRFEEE
ncbi:MAG: HPr family phosphocarrier protein [Treponema sp.]|nr:HPr family phosphocarrier protein [Treponema sp.]